MLPGMLTGSRVFEEKLASVQLIHVLAAKKSANAMIKWLLEGGFVQNEEQGYEEYRVLHGIPGFLHELSTSYNPLEAGLLPLVSFTKGCYIGQEVVARLDTYKKVQRRLVRLKIEELPEELPEKIYCDGRECGSITSAVRLRDTHECRGIGYVRTGSESSADSMYFQNGSDQIKLTIDAPGSLGT